MGKLEESSKESSKVHNCMALNPSVAANISTHLERVVGHNDPYCGVSCHYGTLSNNFAFAGMTGRTWANIGLDNLGGESKTAAQLQTERGFPEELRSGPWTYEPGKLPGLLGKTVAMPSHIPAR